MRIIFSDIANFLNTTIGVTGPTGKWGGKGDNLFRPPLPYGAIALAIAKSKGFIMGGFSLVSLGHVIEEGSGRSEDQVRIGHLKSHDL